MPTISRAASLAAASLAASRSLVCGLCGELGSGDGWADGVAGGGASAVPWLRRQARRQRVKLGNHVLHRYGLRLEDWQGRDYLLRKRTGATLRVDTLADLWTKADILACVAIDPLDPALLDILDDRGG